MFRDDLVTPDRLTTTTICPLITSARADPSFLLQPSSTQPGFLTGNYSYSGDRVDDFMFANDRAFCRPSSSAISGSMCTVLSVIYKRDDPVGRGNMVITYTSDGGAVHTILVDYSEFNALSKVIPLSRDL